MSDIVIRVEGLSKQYRIGRRERYKTLRDSLSDAFATPFRAIRSAMRRPDGADGNADDDAERHIWALKDVSFQIKRGEVVGVIGRNGAGKSTLLKILARITEPTEGEARIRGRVGSLLEVGTGFSQELTGRENIYLNGAILGMKKREIDRQFDEIVAFAEVERFIDTPVKHYSSGMYLRLAFAVAAHLEPEILLVDEVLAVGDLAFQQKCLGKMDEVARKEGRTVLFVSHNMASLANLCPRAILLAHGSVGGDGSASDVISQYIAMGRESHGEVVWNDTQQAPGNENVRLRSVRIFSGREMSADVDIQDEVRIEIEFWNLRPGAYLSASIHLYDRMGVPVLASANLHSANLVRDDWFGKPYPVGLYRTACTLPGNFLNEGRYSIHAIVLSNINQVEVFAKEVVAFVVHDTGAMRKEYSGHWLGVVRPRLAWQTEYLQPLTNGGDAR